MTDAHGGDAAPVQTAPRRDRALILIIAIAAVLVVGTLVLALTRGDEAPAVYPADSPERTVQDYLAALDRGDLDAAYALLAAPYRAEVSRGTFAQRTGFRSNDARIIVATSGIDGDHATITLRLRRFVVDGPTANEYEREMRVTLVREAAGWRLERPPSI